MIPCNFKTGGANVALEKKSCGAEGRIFGANGSLPLIVGLPMNRETSVCVLDVHMHSY